MPSSPIRIDPHSNTEILIEWSDHTRFIVPYAELRFLCPCAACVDEHTGRRTIRRETVPSDIRPRDVQLVGRYALQFSWSDRHATGMYHFDVLREICEKAGSRIGS